MTQAKTGDTVKVHYTGRLDDGSVFDSSAGGDPIEFQLGAGTVIPGFDSGVAGLIVGEKRTVNIPAVEAYGPHHEEAVFVMPRDQFPPDLAPELGMQFRMQHPAGMTLDMTVIALEDEAVTLDANHPLAGKDLHFDLELVAIG
ncbi:MAG: peptidyl-prolyl cis-trans isomerase, FKBP-type [Cyanobacteria bacterium RYN_339]|nr:peptidyl-prolyl cis-trans isomerase, FKBP-type [Cyanobacteria bacterium RYN_339]